MSGADSINPKALRRQVRIEAKESTQDAFGGESVSYVLRAVVHAEVRPMVAREATLGGQVAVSESWEFRIRYRDDVQPTDRIVWKGQPYEVTGILEIGRNAQLRILAKRPGGAGTDGS